MPRRYVDVRLESVIDAPLDGSAGLGLGDAPVFSIQRHCASPIQAYSDSHIQVEVKPGPRGLATIWDKDFLIYLCSVLYERIRQRRPPDRRFTVGIFEFLRATRRSTSTNSYNLFEEMLLRLSGTTVKVTARSDGGHPSSYDFNWISESSFRPEKKGPLSVEVLVGDRVFRAVAERHAVVGINEEYFALDKGLERRLYELAVKNLNRGHYPREWNIGLEPLATICGASGTLRRFNLRLKQIAEARSLPGIRMELMPDLVRRVASAPEKQRYRLGAARVCFTLDQPS